MWSVMKWNGPNLVILVFSPLLPFYLACVNSLTEEFDIRANSFPGELTSVWKALFFNPISLRKAKIVYNFGLSEFNMIKGYKQEVTKVVSHCTNGRKTWRYTF